MATSVKLGLDLGNCTICAVGKLNGSYIYKYISSTYISDIDVYSKGDIVTVDNSTIQIGKQYGSEFASINKYERLYLAHQILWAVNAVYKDVDEATFILDLGIGLPINEYGAEDKRQKFQQALNSIKTITGNVDGKDIIVQLSNIKIQAEGLGSIKALSAYIPKNNYPTLIYDIGFMTTDIVCVTFENKTVTVQRPVTINKGLNFVYSSIFKDLNSLGTIQTKTELDYYVRMNFEKIKIRNGQDYNLQENLMKTENQCKTILNDVTNALGVRGDNYNKIFIGGGSVLFIKILGEQLVDEHVMIGNDLRYSANALGYLMNL